MHQRCGFSGLPITYHFSFGSWAETPESLEMKAKLAPSAILYEGGRWSKKTFRNHLVDFWVKPKLCSTRRSDEDEDDSLSPATTKANDNILLNASEGCNELYDRESEAYIGKRVELDAVGGVATMVRADVHRAGAMFPSWVQDHQVETEGQS